MRLVARACLVGIAALAAVTGARAEEAGQGDAEPAPRRWRASGRLELGAEHDTNPARLESVGSAGETPAIVPSPGGRAVAAGDFAARLGERVGLVLNGSAAGKSFARSETRDENVGILQGSGSLSLRLSDALALSLGAIHYDAFQKRVTTSRDFRSTSPSLRLELSWGVARLFAGGGYRWFTYKPEPDFDFTGPNALAGVRLAMTDQQEEGDAVDWDVSLHSAIESRNFSGQRCPNLDGCATDESLGRRADQFLTAQAEVTRTGAHLTSVGLAGHVNASNTYGQSLRRLIVFARVGFLLPWQVSLAARGDLVLTHYDQRLPVVVGSSVGGLPLVSIEDESRSTIRLELMRSIGDRFELGARWTFYTSEPTSRAVHYQRQMFLVTLALLLGR